MLQQQLEAVQGIGAMKLAIKAPPHQTLNPKLQRFQSAVRFRSIGVRCRMAEPSGKPAPMGQKSFYQDSWTDNFLLGLCARRIGKVNGIATTGKGYDGFVELTRKIMQTRSPLLQRAASMQVIHSTIPPWLLKFVRRFLPKTPKTAEIFAASTRYFEWLVGPCEVKEVEINGVMQKSGVLIKKCRYLEASNCVGLCVNMCKVPTQDFFTNSLGFPVTMTPSTFISLKPNHTSMITKK
jgi:hypothetical protein